MQTRTLDEQGDTKPEKTEDDVWEEWNREEERIFREEKKWARCHSIKSSNNGKLQKAESEQLSAIVHTPSRRVVSQLVALSPDAQPRPGDSSNGGGDGMSVTPGVQDCMSVTPGVQLASTEPLACSSPPSSSAPQTPPSPNLYDESMVPRSHEADERHAAIVRNLLSKTISKTSAEAAKVNRRRKAKAKAKNSNPFKNYQSEPSSSSSTYL